MKRTTLSRSPHAGLASVPVPTHDAGRQPGQMVLDRVNSDGDEVREFVLVAERKPRQAFGPTETGKA